MFTPITLVAQLVHADGSTSSGGLSFQLASQVGGVWTPTGMRDTSTGESVSPDIVQGVIYGGQLLAPPRGGGPYRPLILFATDDPTTVPATGLAYLVTEQLTTGGIPPWPLTVSHSAAGGTIDVGAQRPVPA